MNEDVIELIQDVLTSCLCLSRKCHVDVGSDGDNGNSHHMRNDIDKIAGKENEEIITITEGCTIDLILTNNSNSNNNNFISNMIINYIDNNTKESNLRDNHKHNNDHDNEYNTNSKERNTEENNNIGVNHEKSRIMIDVYDNNKYLITNANNSSININMGNNNNHNNNYNNSNNNVVKIKGVKSGNFFLQISTTPSNANSNNNNEHRNSDNQESGGGNEHLHQNKKLIKKIGIVVIKKIIPLSVDFIELLALLEEAYVFSKPLFLNSRCFHDLYSGGEKNASDNDDRNDNTYEDSNNYLRKIKTLSEDEEIKISNDWHNIVEKL